jgi:mono/diheme cytochrome c family protein
VLTLLLGPAALAAEAELAEEDQACQTCHGSADIKAKKTEAGEMLSMHISSDAFLASRHSETSCTDCHEDADDKDHGKTSLPIESKREYRLSYQDACTTCHKKDVATFKDSVHAYLVKAGDEKAPTCSDCHDSHTQLDVTLVQPIANVPCASCHEKIFKAYAGDVHGLERVAKGKTAPLCADCHSSHKIQAASLGDTIKDNCIACHEDSADRHEAWLPNSGRHFQAVSCVACHAPDAERRINLRLVDGFGKPQVQEAAGAQQFERLTTAVNTSGGALNERELRNFLKAFNAEHSTGKAMLSGRLEVSQGVHAHQLSEKELALKDCSVCHQAGASPFQSVSLTMAGADGRPLRQEVEKEVLNSVTAIGLLRGFYTIGSSRIQFLDQLLVVVLLGVACVPLAHYTAHRVFKRRREQTAQRASDAASPPND